MSQRLTSTARLQAPLLRMLTILALILMLAPQAGFAQPAASTAGSEAAQPESIPAQGWQADVYPPLLEVEPDCIDCPPRFRTWGYDVEQDSMGRYHMVYGGDHLFYATYNGSVVKHQLLDDANGVGADASLVLDANDEAHISYYDRTQGDLRYARQVGESWEIQIVDTVEDMGAYSSIALDPAGAPHIAYFDYTDGDLRHAYQTPAGWQTETVDCDDSVGPYASLAIDAQGVLHIAYFDISNTALKYARHDGDGWQISVVDDESGVGEYISMALDAGAAPHISYQDYTNRSLKYARWSTAGWQIESVPGANYPAWTSLVLQGGQRPLITYVDRDANSLMLATQTASGWQLQAIDDQGEIRWYTKLVLGANGRPAILYLDDGPDDLILTRLMREVWTPTYIDHSGSVGDYPSVTRDSAGNIVVSYIDWDNADIKLASQNDSGWQIESVPDSLDEIYFYNDVALDPQGNPHLAYLDYTNRDMRYAFKDSAGWHFETLESTGITGSYASLEIDPAGKRHLTFYSHYSGDLRYAFNDGGGWQMESIDSQGYVGSYGSLALDSSYAPHVSYFDDSNNWLKYARQVNGVWQIEVVDDSAEVGQETSLALDAQDHPHISYFDVTNQDLKYAYHDGATWHVEVVDAQGYVGRESALTLDPEGRPHISYFDFDHRTLRYAFRDEAGWHHRQLTQPFQGGPTSAILIGDDGTRHVFYYNEARGDLVDARLVPQPELSFSPSGFEQTVALGDTATAELTLTNNGLAALGYQVSEAPQMPWLSVDPAAGQIFPDQSQIISLSFDSAIAGQPGVYNADLLLSSNDPSQPEVTIPLTMSVPDPAMPWVLGVVSSDRPGGVLAGARVELLAGEQVLASALSNDAGQYGPLWTEPGDYELRFSASGYQTATVALHLASHHQLTLDRRLILDAAWMEIEPLALSQALAPGESGAQTITLRNLGPQPLTYKLLEVQGEFELPAPTTSLEPFGAEAPQEKIDPALWSELAASGDGEIEFLVAFRERGDLRRAYALDDWTARGRYVLNELRDTARRSQQGALAQAQELMRSGEVREVQAHYIVNALIVRGSETALRALAARPEVSYVRPLRTYIIPNPEAGQAIPSENGLEWNLDQINADQVWQTYGAQGQGVVVSSIDTGVRYTHEALVDQYRGNLGDGQFDHNYNWWDPDQCCGGPSDPDGHGSHTMGTMVGGDVTHQIGVAPQASWIAAQGCEPLLWELNYCTEADLISSAEWILAPWDLSGDPASADPEMRPHIVNNSWGGGPGNDWYMPYVDAWRAAGIFPAFSIGNKGPACNSASSPGDYPQAFASGATDLNDLIAPFSGRGASAFGGLKPNVSAPGVNVSSAWSDSDSGYNTISGTSMASPHSAGLVALLWSANPDWAREVDLTAALIEQTAYGIADGQCGAAGPPNNVYGWGRIDAYETVALSFVPWLSADAPNGVVPPYSEVQITLTFDAAVPEVADPGDYLASLIVAGDDPLQPAGEVAMTLTISSDLCSMQTEIPVSECQALVSFYESTGGDDWRIRDGWMQTPSPCSWFGVACDNGHVIELVEYDNLLSGTLPASLADLTYLTQLNVSISSVSGPIPPELGQLQNLDGLSLNRNQLSGGIPDSFGDLQALQALRLNNNHLSGPIPAALGALDQLEILYLENNALSGPIPSELGDLSLLRLVGLQNNALEGEIPASLIGLAPAQGGALQAIEIEYNALSAFDPALIAFLDAFDAGWAESQTVPPTNLGLLNATTTSLEIDWTPILYTADGGGYELGYRSDAGEPYTVVTVPGDKSASSMTLDGLTPGTEYEIVLRSFTPAHDDQQSALLSAWSAPLLASTTSDEFVTVAIDIKPGGANNVINLSLGGVIPVAILSTPDFDATTQVDRASLTFGHSGDEESLAYTANGQPKCSAKEANSDGLPDLFCQFELALTGFQLGDSVGILRGQLLDGTAIEGRDAVIVLE